MAASLQQHGRQRDGGFRRSGLPGFLVVQEAVIEAVDHQADVFDLALPPKPELEAKYLPDLLGGVTVIEGTAYVNDPKEWEGRLYRRLQAEASSPTRFHAIPYYAWANRTPGAMTVWLKTQA